MTSASLTPRLGGVAVPQAGQHRLDRPAKWYFRYAGGLEEPPTGATVRWSALSLSLGSSEGRPSESERRPCGTGGTRL
jgi:hypothetical protein